jgi:hypothetical protein
MRVGRARTAEVHTNASNDQFSDGAWLYGSCDHPT